MPREVREALGLQTGDRLAFRVQVDGTVAVEAMKETIRRAGSRR